MNRLRYWLRLFATLLLALLLLSPLAWGRAGNGGHFSGGSHSYGSSYRYSGGQGSSGNSFFLLWLLFRYPEVVIPIALLVILIRILNNNSSRGTLLAGDGRMTRVISRNLQAQEGERIAAAIEQIRQRDAAFDQQQFLARTATAFLKIQEAWSRQDMGPARAFVSDGVMERFTIQIEMQKADNIRNDLSAVNVMDCAIVEAESDAHFDTLHVRLQASAVDVDVSLTDGRRIGGSGQSEPFVEIWSFLRRPGALSLQKPGPIEGYCPSCGAPLLIADAAQCGSCKAWVNSGQYDWVLSEITQESEWAVRGSGAEVPGFTALAQQDPTLNTQFLEDRASVAYWRWQLALSQGNARALLPVATPDFCKAWESDADAHRFRFRDAAVGAVEVRAFESGETMNLAHVAVRWSGDQYLSGDFRAQGMGHLLREHVFILGRSAAARTDENNGLNSCRCPNCGAPPASREDARCSYCGTAFNDGSRQWVVTQIMPIAAWRRPAALLPDAAASAVAAPVLDLGWVQGLSSTEVLAVLVSAMMADGNVDPAEQKYLDRYARNNHIAPQVVSGLIEAAQQGHLEIPLPRSPQEARACLEGLIEMSLADGKVDPAELKLILAYAERAGIDKNTVAQRIKEMRLNLYKQARA
jgi:uncharacterized tellurite resistance protein B-like protein